MNGFRQTKNWCSTAISAVNENKNLVLLIIVLAVAFFLMWKFGAGELHDFGLNAFTETVGIGITVFLVDQLLKNQERRRQRPLQIAAFHDVQSFVDGLATLWLNIYNWSGKDELSPPPEPPSIAQFLTLSYFEAIRQRLNLDAEACVFPKRTWWAYLPQAENQYRQLGEKILERHSSVLDPYAYHLIHKVLNGFLDPNIGLNMLSVSKQAGGFGSREDWDRLPENQRNRLGRYWLAIEENLQDFAALHSWYISHKKEFLGHD